MRPLETRLGAQNGTRKAENSNYLHSRNLRHPLLHSLPLPLVNSALPPPSLFIHYTNYTHETLHPPHALQDGARFVDRHAADAEGPHLGAAAQALQANGDLPALGLLQDEDVALGVLVADGGAQHVVGFVLAGLGLVSSRIRESYEKM